MNVLAWGAAFLVGSLTFALIVARFMRVGGEKAMPTPPLPAHLNPRAGQHTAQAARTTFTAALALAVLVGVGIAQQSFGGAA